jgi:hypothetical protein
VLMLDKRVRGDRGGAANNAEHADEGGALVHWLGVPAVVLLKWRNSSEI